ncbi:MAG: NADH-quinone oxidoreductase subunit NuoG [Gammaproteobacteria bacterium]
MSDEHILIEVDGKELSARRGQMLIEVTDANDIYVPRFCYHNKLTVAANCRMCLVEVEKAPKALPACATPVMEGMIVRTRSKAAVEAQKAIMEFLLINHPLDCPICDQGGECELQDLAMGYGQDVSRYQEKKRVVKDKNIGPLIQTDLTRCIHCTRCVRFGEEIAGLRELGATGRGENMTIGTYIEKSVESELSGNVIDLCPVGALTSKPFRYSARTWELVQRDAIAPHDSVGSNLHVHVKSDRVKRVVPANNEAINEVWISDRDRFSYEGIYSEDRLQSPMIKRNGEWQQVDWEIALQEVRNRLGKINTSALGSIASPSSTLEELYLLQKLMRGLGSSNIDTRLRQVDTSDQDNAPVFPHLGSSITELENINAGLLIGSHVRKEQPMLNHRLRKSTLKGARISVINPVDYDLNYDLANKIIVSPAAMVNELSAIVKVIIDNNNTSLPGNVVSLLNGVPVTDTHRAIAESLQDADNAVVLLGNTAMAHPRFSSLRTLAGLLAELTNCRFGYLAEAANTSGAWLSGAVPHRLPGGQPAPEPGKPIADMFADNMDAYLLLNVEPELDCWNGNDALQALKKCGLVIALTAYRSEAMNDYADILLPASVFAETSGTYINVAGDVQTFTGVAAPVGESRPAWKILRVLGNYFDLQGFDYVSSTDVLTEALGAIGDIQPDNMGKWSETVLESDSVQGMQRISDVPMNAIDPVCRRAKALQATSDVADGMLHINTTTAESLKLSAGVEASVQQDDTTVRLPVSIDDRVPDNCVLIHSGHPKQVGLGASFGAIKVSG